MELAKEDLKKIKESLWKSAIKLRVSLGGTHTCAEICLNLIFLKYISEKFDKLSKEFEEEKKKIPKVLLQDENKKFHYYTNGPGKLCRALSIDISLNHTDLTTSDLIYLEDQPELSQDKIVVTKRINIDYAGADKDRLWRFYIKDNPFVSRK